MRVQPLKLRWSPCQPHSCQCRVPLHIWWQRVHADLLGHLARRAGGTCRCGMTMKCAVSRLWVVRCSAGSASGKCADGVDTVRLGWVRRARVAVVAGNIRQRCSPAMWWFTSGSTCTPAERESHCHLAIGATILGVWVGIRSAHDSASCQQQHAEFEVGSRHFRRWRP